MVMDPEQPCFGPKGKQNLLNPQRIFSNNIKRTKSWNLRPPWNHTDYKMAEEHMPAQACQGKNAQCPAHQKDAK